MLRTSPIRFRGDLVMITLPSKLTMANCDSMAERMESIVIRNVPGSLRSATAYGWTHIVRAVEWKRFCLDLFALSLLVSICYFRLRCKRMQIRRVSQYICRCVLLDSILDLLHRFVCNNQRGGAKSHPLRSKDDWWGSFRLCAFNYFLGQNLFYFAFLNFSNFRSSAMSSQKFQLCSFVEKFYSAHCYSYATEKTVPNWLDLCHHIYEFSAVCRIFFGDVKFLLSVLC